MSNRNGSGRQTADVKMKSDRESKPEKLKALDDTMEEEEESNTKMRANLKQMAAERPTSDRKSKRK